MAAGKVSRGDFIKLMVVLVGTGGALAEACGSSNDPVKGTNDNDSGSSGTSGTSGSSGDLPDTGVDTGVDAADAAKADAADAGDADAGPKCTTNGAATTFAGNHPTPHTLLIPKEDFTTPANKTYTIGAGGDLPLITHVHTVTLTAAQLTLVKSGATVTVETSTTNSHTHMATIKCA